jgi:hypothetical protein
MFCRHAVSGAPLMHRTCKARETDCIANVCGPYLLWRAFLCVVWMDASSVVERV